MRITRQREQQQRVDPRDRLEAHAKLLKQEAFRQVHAEHRRQYAPGVRRQARRH
jgi:hypothetical protein